MRDIEDTETACDALEGDKARRMPERGNVRKPLPPNS